MDKVLIRSCPICGDPIERGGAMTLMVPGLGRRKCHRYHIENLHDEIIGLVESGAHRSMDAAQLQNFLELWIKDLKAFDISDEKGSPQASLPSSKKEKKIRGRGNSVPSADIPVKYLSDDQLDREFHYWRNAYPRRDGSQNWIGAKKVYLKLRKTDVPGNLIAAGTARYKRHCDARGLTGTQYVMMASTFLSRRDFEEEWTGTPHRKPDPTHYPDPPVPPNAKELMEKSRQAVAGKVMECGFCHAKVPQADVCPKCGTANAVGKHSHNSHYRLHDLPPTAQEQFLQDQQDREHWRKAKEHLALVKETK